MLDRTLFRFIAVGIGNTIIGLSVIYAFRQVTSDFLANLLGYVFVVPVSFFTHRGWSFRDVGAAIPAFLRYLPTVAIGYGVNLGVLTAGLSSGGNPYVVQAVAIATYVATTYLITRFFVFRNQPQ